MTVDSFCTLVGMIAAITMAMIGLPAWVAGAAFAPVLILFADFGFVITSAVVLALIPPSND